MLGHWGKKTTYGTFKEKNPVIRTVPDEVIGKDMKKNVDGSMKPTSDVTRGDGKGEAKKTILYNLSC